MTYTLTEAHRQSTNGTKYKEDGLIPAIANISVPVTDDYVPVFDVQMALIIL